MSRLFAKIFLGFWVTTIAVVIATALGMMQFNRALGDETVARHFERTQAAYAAAANAILDSGGLAELGLWLRELDGPGGARGRLQLLDDAGRPVFGSPPATDVSTALAKRDAGAGEPRVDGRVFFDPLYGPDGERYWFVSDMRRGGPMRSGGFARPQFRAGGPLAGSLRFAIAIVVSGVVCFGLARYLTKPIRKLQAASAEIANGNFGVRVEDHARHDELGDLGRDFDRMAEQLERLQASQQQLLRDVSHELRSPLARLQVALGLARQRGGDAVAGELDRIEREAEAIEALIRELLSVARLEADVGDFGDARVDVGELLPHVVRDANYEGVNAQKSVVYAGSAAAMVRGDRALLKSAFENVIRNALHHTPLGTSVNVDLALDSAGGRVIVSVRDHGQGVDPELIPDLFKPFVRAQYARDRDSGGYGIGLAIADAAVKRHRGEIGASNHADGGLLVEILLPCA
ncbi:MAG: ATP-binding protein [Gammaproteobacteria bacterium]|jgi:two-component system sensor histidine kinase CpxA